MQSGMQPTIIRIKRKRADEPLDALVVESKTRRKKSRGASAGFFQFAETVEAEEFWNDPDLTKDLKARISNLASGIIKPPSSETRGAQYESPARRYTVLKPTAPGLAAEQNEGLSNSSAADMTMYDAVLEKSRSRNDDDEPIDPEMEKFIPMLKEYLQLNDEPANVITSDKSHSGNEYVWDVFYHRPATTNWTIPSNIATISGVPIISPDDSDSGPESPGDEDDEDSNTEDFYRNDYPDEDPDEDSDHHLSDYDEEYPELEDSEDDEDADFYNLVASRAGNFR